MTKHNYTVFKQYTSAVNRNLVTQFHIREATSQFFDIHLSKLKKNQNI